MSTSTAPVRGSGISPWTFAGCHRLTGHEPTSTIGLASPKCAGLIRGVGSSPSPSSNPSPTPLAAAPMLCKYTTRSH
jgi:hypothetical protein